MKCPRTACHTQQAAFHCTHECNTCTCKLFRTIGIKFQQSPFLSMKLSDLLLKLKGFILKIGEAIKVVKLMLTWVKITKFTLNHVTNKLGQSLIRTDQFSIEKIILNL